MRRALILTGHSMWALAASLLRGERLVLADVRSGVPGLAPLLRRLADRLVAAGRLEDGAAAEPGFAGHKRFEAITDVYARMFPAIVARFDLSGLDGRVPDYAQALRFALYDTASHRARGLLIVAALRRSDPGLEVLGADDVFAAAYATLDPRPFPGRVAAPGPARRLVNLAMTAGIALLGIAFVLRRLRLRAVAPTPVFLGTNGRLPERDRALRRILADVLDDLGQAMMVFDADEDYAIHVGRGEGIAACRVTDGAFAPAQAAAAIGMLLGDAARLYREAGDAPAPEFRSVVVAAYKRVVYRGLFNRFRFRAFFGRDDYAIEHLVRRMELHRIGGRSLGINHGLPVHHPLEPAWTFLGFDVYYAFGSHLHRRYCRETYDRTMTVRAVGSYGRSRAALAQAPVERSPDIVYFASPGPFESGQGELVGTIAEAFPDRRIRVKVKGSRRDEGWYGPTLALVERYPNVVETTTDSYDLMAECSYALCGTSTVAAEAVQFGLATWVLDTQPAEFPLYYRDFPGLCVTTADEVIDRIRAIEAGRERYPREAFADLVDLSGANLYDVIRADLGLPPRADQDPGAASRVVSP